MARIAFACSLVQYPRPPMWAPRIVPIQHGPTGYFPARWTTTDAIRAEPWAIGIAEVTPEQLAALQADGEIWLLDMATERFAQFNALPSGKRNALNTFLTKIGHARAQNTEVLEDVFDRVVGSNEPLKNLQSIQDELAQELGLPT